MLLLKEPDNSKLRCNTHPLTQKRVDTVEYKLRIAFDLSRVVANCESVSKIPRYKRAYGHTRRSSLRTICGADEPSTAVSSKNSAASIPTMARETRYHIDEERR